MTKFVEETYGKTEPIVIRITRKQIEQMHEMIDHFKDQDGFDLKYENGKLTFNFTIEFDKK